MKDLLKNKKVLVGLLALGVVAYYVYGQKRKADIKAKGQEYADTPAPYLQAPAPTSTIVTPVKLEKELQAPSSAEDVFSGKRNKNTLI